jgi:hypothetical protein
MSKKYIALLLTIAFSGAAVFAGCGGDDSSDSDAPTKAEFIAQADEICQTNGDKIDELTAEFDENTGKEEVIAFTKETYIPTLQDEVNQLKELTPPAGEEEAVDSMLTSLENGVNELADDPNIVLAGETNPLAEASAQAKELGLKVCGSTN